MKTSRIGPAPAGTDDTLCAALEATIDRARGSALYAQRLAGVHVRSLHDLHRLPLTTRADLQAAGTHGTRAVPLERVCHYQESSGTSGAVNSAWLTAGDLERSAEGIRRALPDVFAPGRIVLNRFPFMAAPAHLIQLLAQGGGGVAIPAGNINWDVPFPRALDICRRTGAHVLAGLPLEPIVLSEIARSEGIDLRRDVAVDTLFLGGSPLPPALQARMARLWGARVVELYGSTETMLLGTSCRAGRLHLESTLVLGEVLDGTTLTPVAPGAVGRLVVTTLALEGSPLVRYDTGDVVRLEVDDCPCGDPRPPLTVLGRGQEVVELGGRILYPSELIDAAAAAADALDASVFFLVILPDRLLLRVEAWSAGDPTIVLRDRLPGVPVEVECVAPGMLLDTELLGRSPHVYKPVVLSDWRTSGRRILTVVEGMIEWPRPTWPEGRRWLGRTFRTALRRWRLGRSFPVAPARDR